MILFTMTLKTADSDNNFGELPPNQLTRMAFDTDFTSVELSETEGPKNDGKIDVIDALLVGPRRINVPCVEQMLIVRMRTATLTPEAVQSIGGTIFAYMTKHVATQFATAAISNISKGQNLFGEWATYIFFQDYKGVWHAINLGSSSIQQSVENGWALLKDGQMTWIQGIDLASTLFIDGKLQKAMQEGLNLGVGDYHLVRAPIRTGGAFAVVGEGLTVIYDVNFNVIASGTCDFTVLPAINADGTQKPGMVNTVSGSDDVWDVRKDIPATDADDLAHAYGAQI